MRLRSKLTSEMCQKIGSLEGKAKQNRLKAPTLLPFSQKTAEFIEKNINSHRFLSIKLSVPTNFMLLRLLSEICQKLVKFDLRPEKRKTLFYFALYI